MLDRGKPEIWPKGLRACFAAAVIVVSSTTAAVDVNEPVVFETSSFRFVVASNGRNQSFVDKKTDKGYLARDTQTFALISRGGQTEPASACVRTGDLVTLFFRASEAKLVLLAIPKANYIVFEIVSVSDPAIDEVCFAAVRLDLPGRTSTISGIAASEEFAVSARALNLKVNLHIEGGSKPLFRPTASARRGLVGAKVALVGCPVGHLRSILKEVVRSEGLPYSPLGGPFALDAEENRGSYVFATVSEANVDAWVALARKAGLAQIHLIGWEQSLGTYEPRQDLYPHGLEGLKDVVARIHAAGLKAGMHTLTGGISRSDPFVTPVPDSRLAKDGRFTLAVDVSDGNETIPITEPPGDLEISWQYSGRSNVIQIDNELIQYAGLCQVQPYSFTGCTRGAFGTRKAAHTKDATVHHLFAIYGTFQPDEESTLVDEVAERIARVFNACRFDMIYQDGAEGMPGGPYGWARMREAVFSRLQGRVLVEASEWGYLSWSYHSRLGAYDYPNWGLKRFVDIHCRDSEAYQASSLLAAQLGWWAILGSNEDHPAEFPDELEYLCVKALAYDMPMSFQGIDVGTQPWNARQDEYLDMIGRYERLRLGRAVPDTMRTKLRSPREEFRLQSTGDGGWQFSPTNYLTHRVEDLNDPSSTWTVRNPYSSQPLRVRIEALYSAAPAGDPRGVTLAGLDGADRLAVAGTAQGVTATWETLQDGGKDGGPYGVYTAKSSLSTPASAWASVRRTLDSPLNISQCGALGVWIHGDGQGEILNFQLTNPDRFWPTWDEHYVDLDFSGWRYFELHLRERDAERFVDYTWPYGGTSAVFRSPVIRTQVSALTIYYNNLPQGKEVQCRIGPIVARPVVKTRLVDPTLDVNGLKITFPATLESGQYIELELPGPGRLYDERGARIGEIKPKGDIPVLAPGENQLGFSCHVSDSLRARARVTVAICGEPLQPVYHP